MINIDKCRANGKTFGVNEEMGVNIYNFSQVTIKK